MGCSKATTLPDDGPVEPPVGHLALVYVSEFFGFEQPDGHNPESEVS